MEDYSELILSLAAVVLFSLFALHTNRIMHASDLRDVENGVKAEALRITESVIQRASVLPFDELVIGTRLQNMNPESLTSSENFGMPEGRESPIDFDDFHGKEMMIYGVYGEFVITCEVEYIAPGTVSVPMGGRSVRKRLTVTTNHEQLNSPVRMRYLKSYY